MKRLAGILMVLLLLLICLCGCNSANVNSEVDVEDKVVTSTSTTVTGGGTQNKKDDGKGSVSTVISSEYTSTTKAPDKIINEYDKIDGLDLETVKKIKSDYRGSKNINLDEIILTYCSTLSDGSVVVLMERIGSHKIQGFTIITEYIADEYVFTYKSNQNVKRIYKNGEFHTIKNAYDKGIISKDILDEYAKKFPDDFSKIEN